MKNKLILGSLAAAAAVTLTGTEADAKVEAKTKEEAKEEMNKITAQIEDKQKELTTLQKEDDELVKQEDVSIHLDTIMETRENLANLEAQAGPIMADYEEAIKNDTPSEEERKAMEKAQEVETVRLPIAQANLDKAEAEYKEALRLEAAAGLEGDVKNKEIAQKEAEILNNLKEMNTQMVASAFNESNHGLNLTEDQVNKLADYREYLNEKDLANNYELFYQVKEWDNDNFQVSKDYDHSKSPRELVEKANEILHAWDNNLDGRKDAWLKLNQELGIDPQTLAEMGLENPFAEIGHVHVGEWITNGIGMSGTGVESDVVAKKKEEVNARVDAKLKELKKALSAVKPAYKENLAYDNTKTVDPTNLTKEQRAMLSNYAASLISEYQGLVAKYNFENPFNEFGKINQTNGDEKSKIKSQVTENALNLASYVKTAIQAKAEHTLADFEKTVAKEALKVGLVNRKSADKFFPEGGEEAEIYTNKVQYKLDYAHDFRTKDTSTKTLAGLRKLVFDAVTDYIFNLDHENHKESGHRLATLDKNVAVDFYNKNGLGVVLTTFSDNDSSVGSNDASFLSRVEHVEYDASKEALESTDPKVLAIAENGQFFVDTTTIKENVYKQGDTVYVAPTRPEAASKVAQLRKKNLELAAEIEALKQKAIDESVYYSSIKRAELASARAAVERLQNEKTDYLAKAGDERRRKLHADVERVNAQRLFFNQNIELSKKLLEEAGYTGPLTAEAADEVRSRVEELTNTDADRDAKIEELTFEIKALENEFHKLMLAHMELPYAETPEAKAERERAEAERLAEIKRLEEEAKRAEAERLAKIEADRLAKIEADKKAKAEADRLAKIEAERLAKAEADRLAKIEADKKAKEEAERLAKAEADKKAKEEADRLAKIEADKKAKAEADRLAKEEADKKAKEEADRLAKAEADKKAKEEADRLAKIEADKKAKEEADRLAKIEADKKAKEEADRLAKEEADKKANAKSENGKSLTATKPEITIATGKVAPLVNTKPELELEMTSGEALVNTKPEIVIETKKGESVVAEIAPLVTGTSKEVAPLVNEKPEIVIEMGSIVAPLVNEKPELVIETEKGESLVAEKPELVIETKSETVETKEVKSETVETTEVETKSEGKVLPKTSATTQKKSTTLPALIMGAILILVGLRRKSK